MQVEILPSPALSTRTVTNRRLSSLKAHLLCDVDPAKSTITLSAYCFMTGFIDAISFTAVFIWCGFQTGNTVQLSLALARLFEGDLQSRDHTFHIADQQALCSLLAFMVGATLGRVGDRIGAQKRLWLFLGTMLQAVLTMVAAIAIWKSGQGSEGGNMGRPAWTGTLSFVCLALISASMGLQGIMGKRINTQFATTVVLTTVWCEFMADPDLFRLRRRMPSRDQKLLAIFSVFFGGFAGRAIVNQIGDTGALGVATGMRIVIAVGWLFVGEAALDHKA